MVEGKSRNEWWIGERKDWTWKYPVFDAINPEKK